MKNNGECDCEIGRKKICIKKARILRLVENTAAYNSGSRKLSRNGRNKQ
jgi:hypothetical protein